MPQDAGVATDLDIGEELLEMFKYLLLGVNALLFIAAALVFATSPKRSGTSANTSTNATAATPADTKHALLVTAHPDDESMFFLPLIHSLTQQQSSSSSDGSDSDAPEWEVHLLCLSRGNFDGLGAIREQEMRTCGAFLGLERANIHVLEDSQLQDGMQAQWDHAHIAKLVLEYIDTHAINAVFTFDDYGVSGHANHIAVHYGVKQAIQEQHKRCSEVSGADDISEANENGKAPVPAPVRGWALESTSILRKYIGVLDALVSSWMLGGDSKESAFVFLCKPWWNYNAMALHHSQFVWYRRLFVLFSRYTFVNTFQPIVYIPTATVLSLGETKKIQ